MTAPRLDVSVVIPYFEASGTIGRAIQSVKAQVPGVREIVVVDDGSVREPLALDRSDSMVKAMRIPHQGPAAARNVGWRAAAGATVAFLDSDDEWLPFRTVELAVLLGRGMSFICGDAYRVVAGTRVSRWSDTNPPSTQRALAALLEDNFVCQSTVTLSRQLLERANGYDERFDAWEDIDLWYRLASMSSIYYLERPTVLYHMSCDTLSTRALAMARGRVMATKVALSHTDLNDMPRSWRRERQAEALMALAQAHARNGSRVYAVGSLAGALACKPALGFTARPVGVLARAVRGTGRQRVVECRVR